MRQLTASEARSFQRAERRRRAAAHFRRRQTTVRASLRFTDDLLAALAEPATAKQVRFKIALREQQADSERSLSAMPALIALFEHGQQQALTDLGVLE